LLNVTGKSGPVIFYSTDKEYDVVAILCSFVFCSGLLPEYQQNASYSTNYVSTTYKISTSGFFPFPENGFQ
jgi:hypothetical protein